MVTVIAAIVLVSALATVITGLYCFFVAFRSHDCYLYAVSSLILILGSVLLQAASMVLHYGN